MPSGDQGPHDFLAVAVGGLGGQHRVTVNPTDRGTANVVGGVEPPDPVGPSGEHPDGIIERRLVAARGLPAGDAVLQVMRHARFEGDVKLQLA